jgi:hypothetical protein
MIDPDGGFAYPEKPGTAVGQVHTDADGSWAWNGNNWEGQGSTPDLLNEVIVGGGARTGFNTDLTFNVIGTIGDAGEMFDFGRYYIEDNKFLNLNLPSKYLGAGGDIYDLGSGTYKIINSKTDAERKSNIISTGVDCVVIGVSQKYPAIGVVYGTLKIIGDSDVYHKAQHDARRDTYYKKHGSYPDGVNQTATLRQDSGMYRECATCPLKFR